MNPEYVKDVRRFGGSRPYIDENGKRYYVSHEDDFNPDLVKTDGNGNIAPMPLLRKKPCFGRPERWLRAACGGKPWNDEDGERRPGKTPCDTCKKESAGVFEACANVVTERIESSSAINSRIDEWADACGDSISSKCFIGANARKWHALLQSIIDHGGWANVNDDQVKIEGLRLAKEKAETRKASRKAKRRRERDARRGIGKPITLDYMDALRMERNRRATHLKGLRGLSGRGARDMLWLNALADEGCNRIADVWRARELLSREAATNGGTAIAARMVADGNNYNLELPSLKARVYEDIKRIAKLEANLVGSPLWSTWDYTEAATAP